MAAKTLQQVLEAHDKIVEDFEKHRKTLSRTRPTGNGLVVAQKRKMLARLDQRLENAVRARDDAIKRHDDAIARIELSRGALAEEIAADEKKLGGRGNDGGGDSMRPTQPTGPVATTPTRPARPSPPILQVRGVGAQFGKRLQQKNIRTAGDLAAMDPLELAETLSISEKRARDLVREAKKTQ